jgi:hypothetical protein
VHSGVDDPKAGVGFEAVAQVLMGGSANLEKRPDS